MLQRKDIIERLAKKGYTKKDSGVIIDDFLRVILEALVDGESVNLHGFGTFEVRTMSPRKTHNIQTGAPIDIPAFRKPKFTAGKLLKRSIREGYIQD